MRIAYCTNVRLPSERAHGHQIASVVQALHRLGHEISIIAPYRKNVVTEDFWTYYKLPRSITLTHIGFFDPISSPFLPGVLGLWCMNAMLRRALRDVLGSRAYDCVYTRSPSLVPALLRSKLPVIVELHQLPRLGRRLFVSSLNASSLVVCLTSSMAATLRLWGVNPALLMVEGDAVDLNRFTVVPTTEESRERLGVHTDRCVVGYVGRLKTLGMEKGVDTLLEAVSKDRRFFAFIVGGPAADQSFYEARASHYGLTENDVRFTGEVPPTHVPAALMAADVLAMPFPDFPHYRQNMSPLKMFEYMASGKPIVTSDLPTIRDVLSEKEAFFCTPGDTESFMQSLAYIFSHSENAKERAQTARKLVLKHTWEERMKRILERFSRDRSSR